MHQVDEESREISVLIGRFFQERRQRRDLSVDELSAHLAEYWHCEPSEARGRISRLELSGHLAGRFGENGASDHVGRLAQLYADYASALRVGSRQKKTLTYAFQRLNPSFVWPDSSVMPVRTHHAQPYLSLTRLEEILGKEGTQPN